MHKARPKLDKQLFFFGFILSVMFSFLLFGLLFINYQAYESGSPDYAPLLSAENTPSAYTVRAFGASFELRWDEYRKLEPYLQKLALYIPPEARAMAAGLHALGNLAEPYLPEKPAGQ